MSRAGEIISGGDPREILRMALGARFAASDGRYCECAVPAVVGLDLMCGECLLESAAQIELRTRRLREPHRMIFDPLWVEKGRMADHPDGRWGLCSLCACWLSADRHVGEPVSRFEAEAWNQWPEDESRGVDL